MICTNEDGSDEIMIQDPSCGDIGYADIPLIANFSEDDEQLLEERPRPPRGYDDVEVFLLRGGQGISATLLIISVGLWCMEPLVRKEAATLEKGK